MKIHMACPIT